MKGFDCGQCRAQYEANNRSDAVPCDIGGIEKCPFFGKGPGSPGDTSEEGCGLAPENVDVVDFYPKWKALGPAAFELLELNLGDDLSKDLFASKLMAIEAYAPMISQATTQSSQEAEFEKQSERKKGG